MSVSCMTHIYFHILYHSFTSLYVNKTRYCSRLAGIKPCLVLIVPVIYCRLIPVRDPPIRVLFQVFKGILEQRSLI